MPNWCSTEYAIYSDNEIELIRIFMLLKKATEEAEEHDSRGILGVLRCPGEIIDAVDGRTSVKYFSLFDPDHECGKIPAILIETESAWAPCNDFIEALIRQAVSDDGGDVEYCYVSEEEGVGLFVNTDTSGKFFDTRVRVDYATPDGGDVVYFGDDNFDNFIALLEEIVGEDAVKDIESYEEFLDAKTVKILDDAFMEKYKDYKEDIETREYFLCVNVFESE